MLNKIDLSRVDLNLLVLFEVVLREGNVGRAAAALNLSPSAVSHGLGRLRRMMNDPLFLRTTRGVVPTDRAVELAPRIAEVLDGVRELLAGAEPFEPATSSRRFRLGVGDAFLCVHGPKLSTHLAIHAPNVSTSIIHIVPSFKSHPDEGAWDHVLTMLEQRELDAAILPWVVAPTRYFLREVAGSLDRLVAVTRPGHPYAQDPTLDSYCAARHLVVSVRGDPVAATDSVLRKLGRQRKVAMTTPNFSSALFLAAESDLVVSLPESLIIEHGKRFGLVSTPLPFEVAPSNVVVVSTRAAMMDAGVSWLVDVASAIMGGEKPS